ncbi:hypothetical protein ACXR8U_13765 [Methylobacterium radiotolerans]|jgi:hypothetical protein|uniref:hypothetical protein n=1 Tax=Methylobacterium TaxID=407 RepID=UPI0005E9F307|nr:MULTISPECIES: hypothetical protein [Methylobacterium]GAN49708.1 hypothetical protein ME121_3739 [Methylobacterium sp. ME121]
MPAAAGPMNQQVQFLRRVAGEYQAYGDWQWAAYSFERPTTISYGGLQLWGKSGRLTVRNSELAITLKTSDRVRMGDAVLQIITVKTPARTEDDLDIEVQSALTADLYEDLMDGRGEMITLRRLGQGAPIDAQVRAIVTGFQPDELASGVIQGNRRVFLFAPDVAAAAFPVPIKNGSTDRLVIRGRTLTVEAVDDSTHRVGGELLAYDIQASGA